MVDRDVVGSNPAHPREVTQGGEQVVRHDVPTGGASECDEEELLTAETTTRSNTGVRLCVERVEERTCDKVVRPDFKNISTKKGDRGLIELTHGRWLDQEATSHATNREANQLGALEIKWEVNRGRSKCKAISP